MKAIFTLETLGALAGAFLLIWLFSSCAQKPLTVPSGGAVTGGISRSQSAASTAQQQQKDIATANSEAQRAAARIDSKDKFLEGYRKWKLSHP